MTGQPTALPDSSPAPALPPIHGLRREALTAFLESVGQPSYRAAQIWQWLYVQRVPDWSLMLNIPTELRTELAQAFSISAAHVVKTQGRSTDVRKILVGLHDAETVEVVLIPTRDRRTVCISSQVGCRFHCTFCASGQAGFTRNLDSGEMVAQILIAAEQFSDRPTNVVFMGIGEPFDNYDNVLKAVRIINDADGLNVGARKITISTCGIVPGIERLAGEGLQVELSISLHAPTNGLRSSLMPVNRKYQLAALTAACKRYADATNRIITFEYTLIEGVNDSTEQAAALARLLSPLHCRVNLIPLSPINEYNGRPTPERIAQTFIDTLARSGINATLRSSRGCAMEAACGQLRSQTAT